MSFNSTRYEARRAASEILEAISAGKDEIRLGHACREMDRIAGERGWGCSLPVTPAIVSRMLRAHGWRKAGMAGSGYDREPLYRRHPA
jgi:hypothetical protein